MTANTPSGTALRPSDVFASAGSSETSVPIWLVSDSRPVAQQPGIGDAERRWLESLRFTSAAKKQVIVPGPSGRISGVALGLGNGTSGDPSGHSELLLGQLAASLPPGVYHLADECAAPELAALAWGLGAYRFRRYKSANGDPPPRLKLPRAVAEQALRQHGRGRLARTQSDQHARRRHGPGGDRGGGARARPEARRHCHQHHRRRSLGRRLQHDSCRGAREPQGASPHRHQMAETRRTRRRSRRDARRQGHLVRHRRPRHQAGVRDAADEEGHGRRGRRADARPHDHGAGTRRPSARAHPRRRECHCRRRLPPGRRADEPRREDGRDRQHGRRGPPRARRRSLPCRRRCPRYACSCSRP